MTSTDYVQEIVVGLGIVGGVCTAIGLDEMGIVTCSKHLLERSRHYTVESFPLHSWAISIYHLMALRLYGRRVAGPHRNSFRLCRGLFLIKVPLIGVVFIVPAVIIGMLIDDGYQL